MSESVTQWTVACVHEILLAKILVWFAISSSGDLPDQGIKSRSPALQAGSLLSEPYMCIYMYIISIYICRYKNTSYVSK